MVKHKTNLVVLLAFLVLALFVGRSLSQMRRPVRPARPPQPGQSGQGSSRHVSSSRQRQETDQTREQSLRPAVKATEEQWKVIKPALEKVKKLQQKACVAIGTSGGAAGGAQRRGGSGFGAAAGGSGSAGGFGGSGSGDSMSGGRANAEIVYRPQIRTAWHWSKSWAKDGAVRKDEKTCSELFSLLRDKKARQPRRKRPVKACLSFSMTIARPKAKSAGASMPCAGPDKRPQRNSPLPVASCEST
jgi:hypothetical protein